MRDSLWLVKNGVPFDIAFGLDDTTRVAFSIILGEMEGGKFNWGAMEFER